MLTIAFSIFVGTLAIAGLIELILNRNLPFVTYLMGLMLYAFNLIVALMLVMLIVPIFVTVLLISKTPKMASKESPNLRESFNNVLKKFIDLAKEVPRFTSETRPANYSTDIAANSKNHMHKDGLTMIHRYMPHCHKVCEFQRTYANEDATDRIQTNMPKQQVPKRLDRVFATPHRITNSILQKLFGCQPKWKRTVPIILHSTTDSAGEVDKAVIHPCPCAGLPLRLC
jgi:uncharacterized membrane protein